MNKEKQILVCVPTYNEKDNVYLIYEGIKQSAPECDILFCDDNSPDGTGNIVNQLAHKDPCVHALHRPKKLGLGTAQRDALEYARTHGYTYAIIMDADLTHNPIFLTELIKQKESADVVIGSRYIRGASMHGWSFVRLPFTHLWRSLIKTGLGLPYDATGAFRLYRLSVFNDQEHFKVKSREFAYGLELLYRLNQKKIRIVETPIKAEQRIHGESKLSGKIMREMAYLYCQLLLERMLKRKRK